MDRTIGRLVYKIVGDDKDLEKALAKSYRSLEKTGKRMQQLGAKLTLGLTVPIAGAATAMVKSAIEAEETRAKYETAFAGITDAADKVRDNLTDNFGLAIDEAERLLSSTGDLLKGFGATSNQALTLSDQVQQLAVDLASYNNLQGGATRASEILTKAMLGEREALTSLGIKISETDVQQRLLEQGQQDLTGRALLLAKAQATLELAYQQSGDALGDFARTQDSAANQLRQLQADIRDLSVELGRELLPLAKELLTWARDTVAEFSALDDRTKRAILVMSGLAAAIGPTTVAIGTLVRAMGNLRKAMLFLGPGGLAVGAVATVGALTAAFWKASEPITDAQQKAEMFAESLRQAANQGMDLEEVIAEIAKRGDVTVQQLRQLAIEEGIATDEMREQHRVQQEQSDEHELHLEMHRLKAESLNQQLETEEAITEEIESRNVSAYRKYWDAVNERWRELGLNLSIYRDNLDEIEQLNDPQRQIEELERLESMLELDIGMIEQESEFPNTASARLALLGEIQALMQDITGETETQNEAVLTQRDRFNMLKAEIAESNLEMEYLTDWQRTLIDDAQDINDTMLSSVDALQQGWGAAFQALGEGLKTGTLQAKDLKNALTGAVAAVIKALAEEYAIRAAAALIPAPGTFNPAAAAGYAAVSAAAYAAAGFVSAFGAGGDFAVQEPTLLLAGEKGPEQISIKPVDHVAPPGSFGGDTYNFNGPIYGFNDFAEAVDEATNRAARINRVSKP